jgi:hypothetical protein
MHFSRISRFFVSKSIEIKFGKFLLSRSHWLRSLRRELSSLTRTLGSWVGIPLKAWMFVCAFILCLCCRVCR